MKSVKSPMLSSSESLTNREIAQIALKWRAENERFRFYKPNLPCQRYLELVGNERDMVCVLSTSNGLGKTSLVANILANLIWGPQTKFFDFPLFRDWRYPKRIRFITNPKLTEQIGPFHNEIRKWWPKGQYSCEKVGKNYFSQYKARDWIIDVMSYDQDVEQFEGGTLGLIIMDEPPPQDIYNACISRLRLGGLLLVVMTPLASASWFFDSVLPDHSSSIVYGRMEDACIQHGVNGHLEHEIIKKMVREMPDDEKEARAEGRAMYLKGLIYKSFEYGTHVAKQPLSVPEYAQVWQVVDPAVDKPFASIWGYPDRDGTFYQVAEWPTEDFYRMHGCELGIEEYKKIFTNIELGWNVKKRIIDRHFADVRSLQTNRTLREDFAHIGIQFEPSYTANEEIETGILKVRSWLKYDANKPINSLNKPRYMVSPTCKNSIKGFQRWSFDMKTGKPRDDFKDFMDCVRYALVADPKISEAPPPQVYKRLYG